MTYIKTENLSFQYLGGSIFKFPDLQIGANEQWLLTGNSGCGKTTLLHLIAGFLRPAKGTIMVNGHELTSLSQSETDRVRGQNIGIVFQKPHFIQSLTVSENLSIARYMNNMKTNKQEILELLGKLNINDKYNSKPNELSQGELQRLSIARSIINKPAVILADEPTSSLDDTHCMEAITLLKQQAESTSSALLIVTHDQRLHPFFTNIIQLDNIKQ